MLCQKAFYMNVYDCDPFYSFLHQWRIEVAVHDFHQVCMCVASGSVVSQVKTGLA